MTARCDTTALRAAFARELSRMYAGEVPAYRTLVEACAEINAEVAAGSGSRLGSIERVTAERHGAVRVGTPHELRQVGRMFAALGMHPVGFYDLRDAVPGAVPVVSTAFRPVEAAELDRNPFRVFTSMLTADDPRFFPADLRGRLQTALARRELFGLELMALADRAVAEGGLPRPVADRFLHLAVTAFALDPAPADRAWYAELDAISAVAADIAGAAGTHVNHLTPRVLDIDELHRRMTRRGITMIDRIQGPPRWDGPDVLLRQTSFRALDEPRTFREPDGTLTTSAVRVRFGEVESRGIALTPTGRARYDELVAAADAERAPDESWQDAARRVWTDRFPSSEADVIASGLGHATYTVVDDRPRDDRRPPSSVSALLRDGWLRAEPIVYEDFLPRSAAGIFQSNLDGRGRRDDDRAGTRYDRQWLAGALGREVHDPSELYEAQSRASLDRARAALAPS